MDISEVAKRTGVPASTLRFYEKKGLIASVCPAGERRRFAGSVLDELALIALGQAAGLSLEEIRSMILPGGEPNIDRRLLAAKADEIDALIERLTAMSHGLRHAATCPAASHAQCPSFQKLLAAAASGALARRWGRAGGKLSGITGEAHSATVPAGDGQGSDGKARRRRLG